MLTTLTIPAPAAGRYILAVVPAAVPGIPTHHEAHVFFEHGGFAKLDGDTYGEALGCV